MTAYLAHSAGAGYSEQRYDAHVNGVLDRAVEYARQAQHYAAQSGELLCETVRRSALMHDLGKLDEENQRVLRGEQRMPHLPVNHVDAGAAALVRRGDMYAALAVYSHHRGLPDMEAEFGREDLLFRDENVHLRNKTDDELDELLKRHKAVMPQCKDSPIAPYKGDQGVFFRLMLSCLADADHTDTAAAYGQAPLRETLPELRAKERLAALDDYVSKLGGTDKRSMLRREMYTACRDADTRTSFASCDSPVGSGKTTAVMAHLLRQASRRGARRIFVVLPYTSIITQSVDVYRKALVLPGENPEEVVAELHCHADFQNYDTRYLTSLWRAPIVVTTAVAFFETLSSNRPSALRRLHELPGSVVFIDESHNALPLRLLPLAWHWMNAFAKEWNTYWVLASGSLVRFWELENFCGKSSSCPDVPELVDAHLRDCLMEYEKNRIVFRLIKEPLSREELITFVCSRPGPRLLIMNTVQSAAVLADMLRQKKGENSVLHLSTALTAEDRADVIARVRERLKNEDDDDWTLVATSCVEAGVDFSFKTGFRELSSLLSLLQAAGRVNRHGAQTNAEMWSFSMQDDSALTRNPALKTSIDILAEFFADDTPISPELSTSAMNKALIRDDSCLVDIRKLQQYEEVMQFKTVDEKFHVIDSNTVTAIIDDTLCEKIRYGGGDWRQVQKKAVSIRYANIKKWGLQEIASGVYKWTLGYDPFLGYMRGVLDLEAVKSDPLII